MVNRVLHRFTWVIVFAVIIYCTGCGTTMYHDDSSQNNGKAEQVQGQGGGQVKVNF